MAFLAVVAAICALVFAYAMASFVTKQPEGTPRMAELASAIHGGAKAFLFAEYRVLVIFIAVLFVLIGIGISWITAVCFVVGALFSIAAGYIGMDVATKANVRTANAAQEGGMTKALSVAFRGGSVIEQLTKFLHPASDPLVMSFFLRRKSKFHIDISICRC